MSVYYIGNMPVSDELYHHGIKGQHWGIRRYQNPDGSLTSEGIRRYGTIERFNAAQDRKIMSQRSRENRKEFRYEQSVRRGAKSYSKGYNTSKNIVKTFGKVIVGSTAAYAGMTLGSTYLADKGFISRDTANALIKNAVRAEGAVAGLALANGAKRELDHRRFVSSGRWKG